MTHEGERSSSERVLDAFQETYRNDIRRIDKGVAELQQSAEKIVQLQTKQQEQINKLILVTVGDDESGVDGYGKRIKKLESFKSSLAKHIGIIAGVAIVLGMVVGWLIKLS